MLGPGAIGERFRCPRRPGEGRLAVHEEEFHLDRADRRHVELLEALDNARKRIARIGIMRLAVEIVDGRDILCRWRLGPGNGDHAAGRGPQQEIAVAFVEDEAGLGNILAGGVEHQSRDRQEASVAPAGDEFVAAQDLATLYADEIGPDQVKAFDGGIGVEEALRFTLTARGNDGHD